VVVAPGEIWNYSGGCTEILGALLHKCTSKPIDEFAQEACSSRWHRRCRMGAAR
jgi:CubicO group peptidase (beta-lactamase class C family)